MKEIYTILILSCLVACGHNEDVPFTEGNTEIDDYSLMEIEGFSVYVEKLALREDSDITQKSIELLSTKLAEIKTLAISEDILLELEKTPFFMDWETTEGGAVYHPNVNWLLSNGYIPEKAKSIEISNVTNFYNWTLQNQPYLVLHELTHSYHDRVLNNQQIDITNAYENALNRGLYTNIPYHIGGGQTVISESAYSLTNEFEFFAELTEAYFGENDYYPFTKNDLKEHDPMGFEAVEKAWKIHE